MKAQSYIPNILIVVLVLSAPIYPISNAYPPHLSARHANSSLAFTNSTYILFQDDFNNGNADGWITSGSGTWYVENGEYVVDMGIGYDLNGISLTGSDAWMNYTLDVEIKGDLGTDKGVLFRCNDIWNGCYYINLVSDPVNVVAIGYLVNHVGVQLSSAPYSNSNGNWYHAQIALSGRNIKVYINEQLMIDYMASDATYVTHGKIGLSGFTGATGSDIVRFDNVVVRGALTQYMPIVVR